MIQQSTKAQSADSPSYLYQDKLEELLNQTGYMYMQFEQFDKSYAFFKMYIDDYPDDANAYDSMADYYESQNDYSNALKSVTRAYELSQKDYHKNRMEELKKKI